MRITKRKSLSDIQFALLLLIPAFVVIGFVIIFPLLQAIYYSFTNKSILFSQVKWKGLGNYKKILTDKVFWEVFCNTVVINFSAVILEVILGLGLALLLNQPSKVHSFLRGLFLDIWVLPFIVVTLLWMWLFNADYGLVNYILKKVHLIGKFIPWLALGKEAKIAVIIVYVWRGTPFVMIMILAGLQAIPNEVIDAAKIDGANSVNQFIHITLPYLRETIAIASLLSVLKLFQNLIVPFTLTRGGPIYSTTTFCLHVYKIAFQSFQMGEAAAIGCLWMIFLFLFSGLFVIAFLRKERIF